MSTLAPVTTPTSDFQLGNGSRNRQPNTNAMIRLNHGTPFLCQTERTKPDGR